MVPSPRRRVPVILVAPVFLTGVMLVAYGLWIRPLIAADRARAAGNIDAALAHYGAAADRFGRFRVLRAAFAGHHSRAAYNELALLYQKGDFDTVLEKAAAAPPGASPQFWSGSALLSRALAEKRADTRLALVGRAEDELKRALQAAPDDWNTKFNYELAARLAAELRLRPPKSPATDMQLLRPQPRQATPVRRTG